MDNIRLFLSCCSSNKDRFSEWDPDKLYVNDKKRKEKRGMRKKLTQVDGEQEGQEEEKQPEPPINLLHNIDQIIKQDEGQGDISEQPSPDKISPLDKKHISPASLISSSAEGNKIESTTTPQFSRPVNI